MTRHPIMLPPTASVVAAQQLMAENNIRHLPIVGDGKRLLGLLTRQRFSLKPDTLGSLEMWEITQYIVTQTVSDIMLKAKEVHTITPDRTVERAAQFMATHKIGCLPVLEDEKFVIGILTETDLLQSYQIMLGLPSAGVRVTVRMPNRPGEFSKLMSALGEQNWGVMGIGTYPVHRQPGLYDAVIKIPKVKQAEVEQVLRQIPDQTVVDIREVA